VTIDGSYLAGATSVVFNGTAASYSVVSGSELSATVPAGASSGPISVTTPDGTATTTTPFTVTTPDFAVSAAPATQTVVAGGSARYTVTIAPSGGFGGSVALAVRGLPAGTTASFDPATTSGTSTLTIQAARNAKPATATLTITGTSGVLSHSASVTLRVTKK
jgi:hypothetical protein